jgi:hypothetical protein
MRCVFEWVYRPHVEGGGDWVLQETCFQESDNGGSIGFGGFGSGIPQNSGQKPPCPPVPEGPSGANIDDNIRAAAASFKDALEPKWYAGPDSGEDSLGKLAGHAMWFYNQVKDKGPWDYKYRDPAVNEGKRSKYEPFGNFNYGASGAAAGFSEGQLLRLAGHYQTDKTYAEGENPGIVRSILGVGGRAPYGDERSDQDQIRSGINYYRRKFVLKDCQ